MGEILVVDDFPENLQLMSELLACSGYRVRQATNGKEAMTSMVERHAPVVLIDDDLPDFSGPDLSYHLKAAAENFWLGRKCIIVAVRGDLVRDQMAGWPGADHVSLKPINYEAFDAMIAECCVDTDGAP